jgi:hypothetical protein
VTYEKLTVRLRKGYSLNLRTGRLIRCKFKESIICGESERNYIIRKLLCILPYKPEINQLSECVSIHKAVLLIYEYLKLKSNTEFYFRHRRPTDVQDHISRMYFKETNYHSSLILSRITLDCKLPTHSNVYKGQVDEECN